MIKMILIFVFYSSMGYANNYAEERFEQAWNNPSYTQLKLDNIDINKTLAEHYETAQPVKFTASMLWDVETKKAWDPMTYIPYVVKEGKSWGKQVLENGDEIFVRTSSQRQWVNRDVYVKVCEEVYLNHKEKKATFIGTKILSETSSQPLFHVQHSVEGGENNPINVWRIVHLTEEKHTKLIEQIKKLADPTRLPGFVEIYIKNQARLKQFR